MVLKKLFNITIYETKSFQVNQDWEVPIPGFFIIAAKRKCKSITDLTEEESRELIAIIRKIRVGMKKSLKIKEVCLFQDEMSSHFHLWLLPRYSWMKKVGYYSFGSILKYAKENMKKEKNIQEVKQAAYNVKKYLR